ncbi:hypothetical protein NPIL_115861 [Nephila pilipes]|uniref:Uncharacterized protein n=1 Tax=Nephila pilipes TaxID=299642 RepID=A0A8X6MI59_NEPPI|nr:hypothetical protein NPIL_115861 [Nephila pilipes]
MEAKAIDSKSVWKTAFKDILGSSLEGKSSNNLDTKRTESETNDTINNQDQNESEKNNPSNNDCNDRENIKHNQCHSSGDQFLSMLKDTLLSENKNSAATNSDAGNSVVEYDRYKSSGKLQNDYWANDLNLILPKKNIDNSPNNYSNAMDAHFPTLESTKRKHINKNSKAPVWSSAIRNSLATNSESRSSSKATQKTEEKDCLAAGLRTLDSPYCNREENFEVNEHSKEKCTEVRWYYGRRSNHLMKLTAEEKEVLDILNAARVLKRVEKPHHNIFDGAGVDAFRERKRDAKLITRLEFVSSAARFQDFPPSQDIIPSEGYWDVEED